MDRPGTLRQGASFFGAFAYPAFVLIWTANTLALVGIAMFDAATGWLMTQLNADPSRVGLVQTATMLPMFLFTLPAGAIADVINPRRFLIVNSALIAGLVACFAAFVAMHAATPAGLLATTFLLSALWALNAPAWLAIIPAVAPREELDSAIAANGFGYNMSRAFGPALGGLAIVWFGASAPFWLFAGANLMAIAALFYWRAPARGANGLPPEHVAGAIRVGLRHALHNHFLRATLIKALAVYLSASAYLTLLPLIARRAHPGAEFYGLMLGAIAVGAIVGSLVFVPLKRRLGPDLIVVIGALAVSLALVLFAADHAVAVVLAACLIAGFGWIVVLSTLYVSAQETLPTWVRTRGLSILLTTVFGAVSLGSVVWGQVASSAGVPFALYAAAAATATAIPLTWPWKLKTAVDAELAPPTHWALHFARRIADEEGPALVTIVYRVKPENRQAFLKIIGEIGHERQRDGAYLWGVYEDVEENGRFSEAFLADSWLDLRRLRRRITKSDRETEQEIARMVIEPPTVRVQVAPLRSTKWPGRAADEANAEPFQRLA